MLGFPYLARIMIFHTHAFEKLKSKKVLCFVIISLFGVFTTIYMWFLRAYTNQQLPNHDRQIIIIATVSFVLCANVGDGSCNKHNIDMTFNT